jgi:hypothetical protein
MIAYCGLVCDTCPIHLATFEEDKVKQMEMKAEIAAVCNEQYGWKMCADDITDCDGCCADTGRIFSVCLTCEIRKCAQEKKLLSCGLCLDYPCNRLEPVIRDDPSAKERLEKIRNPS